MTEVTGAEWERDQNPAHPSIASLNIHQAVSSPILLYSHHRIDPTHPPGKIQWQRRTLRRRLRNGRCDRQAELLARHLDRT